MLHISSVLVDVGRSVGRSSFMCTYCVSVKMYIPGCHLIFNAAYALRCAPVLVGRCTFDESTDMDMHIRNKWKCLNLFMT